MERGYLFIITQGIELKFIGSVSSQYLFSLSKLKTSKIPQLRHIKFEVEPNSSLGK